MAYRNNPYSGSGYPGPGSDPGNDPGGGYNYDPYQGGQQPGSGGGGTQLDLDLYPDTYGYNFSQGKWGPGWEYLTDQQRGDLKSKWDSGYRPPGADEQGLSDELSGYRDRPGILESMGITPEGARGWLKKGLSYGNIGKRRKEMGAVAHKRYTRDFTRAGRAAIGAVGGRGALGSSGARVAAERAAGQFAEGHQEITREGRDWAQQTYREKVDRTINQALEYAKLFSSDRNFDFNALLTELGLKKEERKYATELYNEWVKTKPDPFGLDDLLNMGLSGLGAASGLGWNPLAKKSEEG